MTYGRKLIMVVDDEKDFTFMLKIGLEKTGDYRVVQANDSRRVMRLARRFKPEVILLDISMPAMNGFELLAALKNDSRTATIPVVMLSALSDRDAKTRAAGLYNEDYLTKPVEMEQLTYSIERVLSRNTRCAEVRV
jgi:DNA-binding response OmpR family regulator